MSRAMPKVSVCIPVYNCAAYIESTVESVLAQTFADFELIIVDNHSSDGTTTMIAEWIHRDPRIQVYFNEQIADMQNNWNRTIAHARGEYIKLLPADDLIYPSCLQEQVALLDDPANRQVGIVGCARDIINAEGKKLMTRRFAGLAGLTSGKRAIGKIIRSGTNPLGEPGSILFRRELLERTGLFDGSIPYVIDLDLWVRLLQHSDLYMFSQALCAFRLSPNSESVNTANRHQSDYRRFIARLAARPEFGLSPGDARMGRAMCTLNGLARNVFFRLSRLRELAS
jgi:glycosyltransferase involved in cell wall biosynthesis